MMLRFVAMQRDPTFRAAYRSANGFTRVARYAARAHLRANEATFRCGVGYRPYFKPDAARIASKSRTRRNANNCSLFDSRVRFSLTS